MGWAGEEEETDGGPGADGRMQEGRMCLPGILLHPVKKMKREVVKL